jgi:hypothetical protein
VPNAVTVLKKVSSPPPPPAAANRQPQLDHDGGAVGLAGRHRPGVAEQFVVQPDQLGVAGQADLAPQPIQPMSAPLAQVERRAGAGTETGDVA